MQNGHNYDIIRLGQKGRSSRLTSETGRRWMTLGCRSRAACRCQAGMFDAGRVASWRPGSVSLHMADGGEASLPLPPLKARQVVAAVPWRKTRSARGQVHYPGYFWSATVGGHVVYESPSPALAMPAGREPWIPP